MRCLKLKSSECHFRHYSKNKLLSMKYILSCVSIVIIQERSADCLKTIQILIIFWTLGRWHIVCRVLKLNLPIRKISVMEAKIHTYILTAKIHLLD